MMLQLTFPFLSEMEDESASAAEPKYAPEMPYSAMRGKQLLEALNLIEQAEVTLLEARAAAVKSECSGIIYRFRRLAIKTSGLKTAIMMKKGKIDMRIGIDD